MANARDRAEHGVTAWRLGCRCPRCRSALRKRARIWNATRQVRKGRDPASRTAADPVRRRVEELRAAGWTSSRVARTAGVSASTVSRIRNPSSSRIVAAALMAIEL